ncbi:MAG: hypothetical protein M3R35_01045 [Candidatus Eremiobacteraeota bacterium]|nr:hypothetical protein [Candidatus Eremiobacteraeota bacterium]
MFSAFVAALSLGALSMVPAPAAAPSPAPTPLKEIGHVISTPFCSALRRNIGPAIGHVLDNDRIIAASKPAFTQFAKDHAASLHSGSNAAEDLDVLHLENLIGPMVQNVAQTESLLGNTSTFPVRPVNKDDKQIVALRSQVLTVLEEQKSVLDLISGLVDTQQLGELQAAGHDYDRALNMPETKNTVGVNGTPSRPSDSPTSAPDSLTNAGLAEHRPGNVPDITKLNTDSALSNNPVLEFPRAVSTYQQRISLREDIAAAGVRKAVPLCGGHVSPASEPSPQP